MSIIKLVMLKTSRGRESTKGNIPRLQKKKKKLADTYDMQKF